MARKQTKAAPPRKVRKKSQKKAPAAPRGAATVRMYCQGLGDCFLLSFPRKESQTPYRILIDCGVLQGTPDDEAKLRSVATHLRNDTGGVIDLLIITHEHWDHISGFSLAHEIFQEIEFRQVWLSWAENPRDPAAKRLKAELGKKQAQVTAAVTVARSLGLGPQTELGQDLQSSAEMLRFFGPQLALGDTSPGKRMKLGETMDWLREKVQSQNYCHPGECRTLPEVDGVKVYILGPPPDPKRIRKMNPTGDQGYRHLAATASLAGTIDWLIHPQSALPPGPFDERYALPIDAAESDPFFRAYYGFPNDPLGTDAPAWRRIDNDWLGGVGRLALQLDTGVNNTSLAVAFELPDGGTLIFPGDAQIGNWLSWDDVEFEDPQGHVLPVTSQDLLHRAVFYKVGHHGSHNATRKTGGLEEMTSGDLVAMIPTDQAFAKTRKPPHDGWKMPFVDLYDALRNMTSHRVARADFNEQETQAVWEQSTAGKAAWKRLTFSKEPLLPQLKTQPLYVEYTLPESS